VKIYLEVKGCLFITASSKAGRSQQAVNPIGDPTIKDEVSLNDPTLSIIHKDFSLFKDSQLIRAPITSSSLTEKRQETVALTMASIPPQLKDSGEPCRVRAESRWIRPSA